MTDANDGVALFSVSHSVAPWYRRVWYWLFGVKDIRPDALEEIEINVPSVEDPYLSAETRRVLNGEESQ